MLKRKIYKIKTFLFRRFYDKFIFFLCYNENIHYNILFIIRLYKL